MSDEYKPDVCIYHMPCADGFTAAWSIWKRWPDIEFVEGVYGKPPPDVSGKNVLLVDFSYKRPVLERMLDSARTVTILDHHKSAQADLDGLGLKYPNADIVFDMNRSGAMMAWDYAHDEPPPKMVRHVQDRDLWKFQLHGTREISAVLFSHPYDFGVWEALAEQLEGVASLGIIEQGEAIERKHHKDIAELLRLTTRAMVIGGFTVPVANLPYTMSSDAANALAQHERFGACYYDNADGKRVFSLRSTQDGLDVSEIAVVYGGGGHARAAGFTAEKGWEGDV